MSHRLDEKFAAVRGANRAAFIAYICAGDPSLDATVALALGLEKAGVDILELGVPFSDPLADGAVNQAAAQRALESGATPRGVLACVRAIRAQSQIPIVLYTYMNPLFAFGFDAFHRAAAEAGVDGLLILDLPPDEDVEEFFAASAQHGLQRIRLIAPTTPRERIARIAAAAEGFIYYVSREGVTGEQQSVAASLAEQVAEIRRHTALPVAVGFGISKPEHVREVARAADGVVVGSAIVRRVGDFGRAGDLVEKVCEFVAPLAAATAKPPAP